MELDRQWSSLRRLTGRAWVGLGLSLFYVLIATPLAPILTALLAVSDASHEVKFQPSAQGLQVVLRHSRSHPPSHHHGAIAHALVALAEQTNPAQPDHVIQFAQANLDPRKALRASPDGPVPECRPCSWPRSISRPAPATLDPRNGRWDPPALSNVLLVVRTTVHVI